MLSFRAVSDLDLDIGQISNCLKTPGSTLLNKVLGQGEVVQRNIKGKIQELERWLSH